MHSSQAAVGHLLTFADAGRERAFARHFHSSHRSNDVSCIWGGACVHLLALTLPLRRRQWGPVCFKIFEIATLCVAALTASKAPARYQRWRTAIVAAIYTIHTLCSLSLAPSVVAPGCRGNLLLFWSQELNLSLVSAAAVPWGLGTGREGLERVKWVGGL